MQVLRKKVSFLYVATSTTQEFNATHLLATKFLVFGWPFFQLISFTFKVTFQQRYLLSFLLSFWHFCDLECKEPLAKDLLDWCWEERKKKNLQIADVSFLLVVPITLKKWHCLKTDFRYSVFLATRVNVLPNEQKCEYCLSKQ